VGDDLAAPRTTSPRCRRSTAAARSGISHGKGVRVRRAPAAEAEARAPFDKGAVAVWSFIASETAFFVILILAYVFFNATSRPGGTASAPLARRAEDRHLHGVPLASSFTLWLSEKALEESTARSRALALRHHRARRRLHGRPGARVPGPLSSRRGLTSNLFATTFFTLTGFHGLHVTVGLIALGIVLGLSLLGDFGSELAPAPAVGLYWHFVDVVWIVVFTVVYVRAR
jgi:cytochrome c oxidase subunit I+III